MIAIHLRTGSFSDRWISFAREQNIPFITVDMFASGLLSELEKKRIRGFLFHLPLFDRKTKTAAAFIGRAASMMGIEVFPNDSAYWHFDDKIAQKYLFDSLAIPSCPTWVFYDRETALEWVANATFPKVFKLRCGAASTNVQLIQSKAKATDLINRMFGNGIQASPSILGDYRTKIHKHSKKRDWIATLKRLPETLKSIQNAQKDSENERGYFYVQEYLPGNEFDTRVTIIGDRAFAFRRFVRPGDFRASGSGRIDYDPTSIDERCIQIAFESSRKIGSQCLAYDFVQEPDGSPVIIEVCYAFVAQAVFDCPGHWDSQMEFHVGKMWPQDAILIDLTNTIEEKQASCK